MIACSFPIRIHTLRDVIKRVFDFFHGDRILIYQIWTPCRTPTRTMRLHSCGKVSVLLQSNGEVTYQYSMWSTTFIYKREGIRFALLDNCTEGNPMAFPGAIFFGGCC